MNERLLQLSEEAITTAFTDVEVAAAHYDHVVNAGCRDHDPQLKAAFRAAKLGAGRLLDEHMAHYNNTVANHSIRELGDDHPGVDTRM